MPARRTLTLTNAQRAQLLHHRDHNPKPYVRERCAALLKIAEGRSAHAVAHNDLLRPRDPDTLYAWLDLFEAQGLPGLLDHQQGGYRRHCF